MSLGTGILCFAFEESSGQTPSFFLAEIVGINKVRSFLLLHPYDIVGTKNEWCQGGLFFFFISEKSQMCFFCAIQIKQGGSVRPPRQR